MPVDYVRIRFSHLDLCPREALIDWRSSCGPYYSTHKVLASHQVSPSRNPSRLMWLKIRSLCLCSLSDDAQVRCLHKDLEFLDFAWRLFRCSDWCLTAARCCRGLCSFGSSLWWIECSRTGAWRRILGCLRGSSHMTFWNKWFANWPCLWILSQENLSHRFASVHSRCLHIGCYRRYHCNTSGILMRQLWSSYKKHFICIR